MIGVRVIADAVVVDGVVSAPPPRHELQVRDVERQRIPGPLHGPRHPHRFVDGRESPHGQPGAEGAAVHRVFTEPC